MGLVAAWPTVIDDDLVAEACARAGPDYWRWEAQVAQTGYCHRPVRMVGHVDQVDRATGEVRRVYSTEGEPDSCLLLPCRNRRESVCPSCAEAYRGDTYHLILAGLVGGKGVPQTVVQHPAVFATFTAPSFGHVHSHRSKGKTLQPCRARRTVERCPHGVRMSCAVKHHPADHRLGTPLCPECFDYDGQVLWNRLAPKLWKRSDDWFRRRLARAAGVTVRAIEGLCKVRFNKVAEYQLRGALHFHAVIRLDGVSDDGSLVPPPPQFTSELLERAIQDCVAELVVDTGFDALPKLRWGSEVHLRHLRHGAPEDLSREAVAAYVAKYSTKGTESLWAGRDGPNDHIRRLMATAHDLDAAPEYAELRLAEASGALGYRGHFSTRSRRYSTTLTILRGARVANRKWKASGGDHVLDAWGRPEEDEAVVIDARWRFSGVGYKTNGEAWLALSAAARAREHRRIAREELAELRAREREAWEAV